METSGNLNIKDRTIENLKMLDEIDFYGFFEECSESISDLMRRIENKYRDTKFVDNDIMQGYVFNCIDQWELSEYLKERYPDKFHTYEVTDINYYVD